MTQQGCKRNHAGVVPGDCERHEHCEQRHRCCRGALVEPNGAGESPRDEDRGYRLGAKGHSPGHRTRQEHAGHDPRGETTRTRRRRDAAEGRSAKHPDHGQTQKCRDAEHEQRLEALRYPVLKPLQPVPVGEVVAEPAVVVREATLGFERPLSDDDPAVVEERRRECPPDDECDTDDRVDESLRRARPSRPAISAPAMFCACRRRKRCTARRGWRERQRASRSSVARSCSLRALPSSRTPWGSDPGAGRAARTDPSRPACTRDRRRSACSSGRP